MTQQNDKHETNGEDVQPTLNEIVDEQPYARPKRKIAQKENETVDDENYFGANSHLTVNILEPVDESKEDIYLVKQFDENTAKYRWRFSLPQMAVFNIKRVYSPDFIVGGTPWRILMFTQGSSLSLYLDVADAKTHQPSDWTRFARFQLSIICQKDVKRSLSQEAEKRFVITESDWGFRDFMAIGHLTDMQKGFILNDSILVECVVNVNKDPFLVNPQTYDSKKETGYVGCKNQGATCYMNSLLQSWYHLSYLRCAVYNIPTEENEIPTGSIPLALQRVFYALQSEKTPVDTKELTKAFGWDAIDSFLQHDIQELARVLSDNLEKKMEACKTAVKDTLKYLFEGSIKNYVRCINVQYESSRIETFHDLQLHVKGCKNVYDSLRLYIQEETLDGDNQYDAEKHGKQDAKKGCIFSKLPPVLNLHLIRFEYDVSKDAMSKVNDRYEFPNSLDLSPFLATDSEQQNQDNTYTLFSVLVHSGDVSGGHYYAFINPDPTSGSWYKFDDDKVMHAKEKEAIEDNYGGEEKKSKFFWLQSSNYAYKRFTNAYMLVYIRNSEMNKIVKKVVDEDVPQHLRLRVERDKEELERRKRERIEANKYTSIRFATLEDLKKSDSFDFVDLAMIPQQKVKKVMTVQDLRTEVAQKYQIDPSHVRLWSWESRENKTYRMDVPLIQDQFSLEKALALKPKSNDIVDLFVEISKDAPLPPMEKDDAFLFIKFYDPKVKQLRVVGHLHVRTRDVIASVAPQMNALAGLPVDSPILMYEEVKPSMVEPLNISYTFKTAKLQTGDIITIEQHSKSATTLEFPTADSFYKYLLYRITVSFSKITDPNVVTHSMELLRTNTYQQVVTKLAEQLNVQSDFIRLYGARPAPFKTTEIKTLKDMLSYGQITSDKLVYEILDVPIQEIESKIEFSLAWYNSKVEEAKRLKFLVAKNSTVADVLSELKMRVDLPANAEVRLMEMYSHKVNKIFTAKDVVTSFASFDLRAEEVAADQLNVVAPDRLVQVLHYSRENTSIRFFGNPFYLRITELETLASVKKRIQDKLEIKEDDFKKYKFAPIAGVTRGEYVADDMIVVKCLEKLDSYRVVAMLGMEHKDPNPKHVVSKFYDRAIVIKN